VRFGAPPQLAPEAGAVVRARVELENTGTIVWRDGINVSYHWLDRLGNPIVWDGLRTPAPALAPGQTGALELPVRGPIPPGPYRLAFDLVAEHRAWFSALGSEMQQLDLEVTPRSGEPQAELPPGVEATSAWDEHVRAAHADGYAVVAGSIDWRGGLLHPRPKALAPYAPGKGRVPQFGAPLLCPSLLPGVELTRLADVGGLPAFAAPADEPWIYEGRAVLIARPRSDRRPT
jgi:hypothetical protein